MEEQTPKSNLHLSVVSPFASYYEGEVRTVQVSTADGQIGILPKHAPLLTFLGYGILRFQKDQGEESYIIEGGFLEVKRNHVTVLANALEKLEAVDRDRAEEVLKEALQMPHSSPKKESRIAAARARLRYARPSIDK